MRVVLGGHAARAHHSPPAIQSGCRVPGTGCRVPGTGCRAVMPSTVTLSATRYGWRRPGTWYPVPGERSEPHAPESGRAKRALRTHLADNKANQTGIDLRIAQPNRSHAGMPRSLSQVGPECVERGGVALGKDLDRAIDAVADPASHAEKLGLVPGRPAEADALHPPGDVAGQGWHSGQSRRSFIPDHGNDRNAVGTVKTK